VEDEPMDDGEVLVIRAPLMLLLCEADGGEGVRCMLTSLGGEAWSEKDGERSVDVDDGLGDCCAWPAVARPLPLTLLLVLIASNAMGR